MTEKYALIRKITPKATWRFLRLVRNFVLYGQFDMFHNVNIETSTICNRACSYCPRSIFPRPKMFLSPKLWKKTINDLEEIGYSDNLMPVGYGEPLLDRRLPDFIKYARQTLSNAFISVYTNGDFMDSSIFNKLVSVGVDKFVVSLHKPRNNFMDFYRELPDEKKKYIKFNITENITKQLNTIGGLVNIPKKWKKVWKKCDLNQLTIKANGDVAICCHDYFGKVIFGNVGNEKLIDIWNKPQFKQIRKNLRKGEADLELCKKCMEI